MSTLDQTPGGTTPGGPPENEELAAPAAPAAPRTPPGPPLDRVEPLNLSRRPFLNSRPVVRVSLLLLLLGLALLMWNVVQFRRYLEESADKRAQIEKGEREVVRQQQASAELDGRLAALDLEQMNERVEFLNEMIAERTFSWSLLLDRLAEVLPNDVRLVRLTPKVADREQQQRRRTQPRAEGERRIPLNISAESRNDEALLQFVDNLFAHPAFADPDLTRQERVDEAGNLLKFDVNVQYIPGGSPRNVIEEVPAIEEMPAPGTAGTGGPGTAGAPGAPGNPGGGRP